MLNDDELEAMYLEMIMTEKDYSEFSEERGRELEQLGKRLKDREITQIEYAEYLERTRTNEGIREDMASRVSKRIENEPYYKDKMRKTLKGYDPDKLAANYQKVYLSSGTEESDEDSSDEQREEARRSYAEAYKNYNDAMEKNYQAAEAMKEAKADHKLATMNGASAVKKAENKKKSYLSQGMEKLAGYISDWQQSDAYLEGIVPQMPNYFSKQNQAAIYYSRYNFQKFVVDPQRAAAETGLMYGIIAVVTAIPTGGTSLYLLAAAELMVGVGQIWINAQKLNDLNHGIIDSNPSFLMMDQNTLDTLDLALSLINLSMLAKHGMMKAADKFKNSQKIIAFREATEKLGNKFDDINKAINPKNYTLEDVQVHAIPGGGSLGKGGKRLVRSGDEPLFQFSKGADEGPKKPYKDKTEGKGKREKEARERREREERERREREKREREKKEKEERERKEREKKEKEERERKEREKKEKEERERKEREKKEKEERERKERERKEKEEAEGTGQDEHKFPTRLINLETEGYILQRVSELKGRLSNGALNKSGANFGYAEVNIPGVKNEFYAHSQVDGPSPPHQAGINYDGFSFKPQGEVRYPAEDAPNSLGKIISRDSDTEHKIINDLANQLGPPNPNIKGRMKLFTENDTCISCNKNISAFHKDYPGITIEVIHNGDNKVPKK
ncbi:deaminase domain-containing protein [Paenibacillus sp. CAA11]|uniref:deaminase domain-containing protein n=1 Tax=Paenibacillus sp. CAA11 TaxID=1532905 RepID=UPI00131F4438|nr:deaminase domain-containing protein [Paenibacillus sp. CAA11]